MQLRQLERQTLFRDKLTPLRAIAKLLQRSDNVPVAELFGEPGFGLYFAMLHRRTNADPGSNEYLARNTAVGHINSLMYLLKHDWGVQAQVSEEQQAQLVSQLKREAALHRAAGYEGPPRRQRRSNSAVVMAVAAAAGAAPARASVAAGAAAAAFKRQRSDDGYSHYECQPPLDDSFAAPRCGLFGSALRVCYVVLSSLVQTAYNKQS